MKTTQRFFLVSALLLALGSSWMAKAVLVTFQVNMSIQEQLGNFTPGLQTVTVAGSFNSWDETVSVLAQSESDPSIYEGTFDIAGTAGTTIQYKFVYGGTGWEIDGVGPSGAQNRQFALPASDTVLDVVYFNNEDTLPATRDVIFRVDMSIQRQASNFDPSMDFVYVAGTFNGWSTSDSELMQSVDDTNVWEGTFTVAGNVGTTTAYKFLMATFASGEVWEDAIDNRELLLEATNQSLPAVYFDNLDTLPITNSVTFQVDMAAQMALGNFVEGINYVVASGSFNNWDAVSFVLTNDPADPYIYKGTTAITAGLGTGINYQYVIDAVDWETAVGNRNFALSDTAQALPPVYWNNVDNLGEISTSPLSANQVEVMWTPGPMVRLQTSGNLPSGWSDVEGTTGASNAVVNLVGDETYLRLIGP